MWELPAFAGRKGDDRQPVLRIRHSITNTNYYVEVFAINFSECSPSAFQANGKWVAEEDLREVALTGLARKILMRLEVLARPRRVRLKRNLPGLGEGLG
jgi:A/G-specific adenine glycosylase